jgi:EAL domain-containing protein (putative c-di-GMP-specific phosphodiesterase class I)
MARSLGLKTTAEGVETQGELGYLRRVGCTEAQGYLFSKAVPAKEVHALLRQQEMQATVPAAVACVGQRSASAFAMEQSV